MILLIDNYDSFSYNLYQLVGSLNPEIRTVRNDKITLDEMEALAPEAILLSPGPGRPEEAGICLETIRRFAGEIPILGVCLGHQAIGLALGGTVSFAKTLMHGKTSVVTLDGKCPLFDGLPEKIAVARYHSLAVMADDRFPAELQIVATADDGEIMAIADKKRPLYGLQFHPESIMTPDGETILRRFLAVADRFNRSKKERKAA